VSLENRQPVKVTYDIPGQLYLWLKAYCAASDKTRAKVVRRYIEEGLKRDAPKLKPEAKP
jgi:hypothetical protein